MTYTVHWQSSTFSFLLMSLFPISQWAHILELKNSKLIQCNYHAFLFFIFVAEELFLEYGVQMLL